MSLPPVFAASALYDNLLQAALRQFFGRATFETEPIPSLSSDGRLAIEPTNDPSVLSIRWFGSRHVLHVPARRPFTAHEVRLARAIGTVLAARYRAIFDPKQMLERGDLFRGAIEDRYVGAFLEIQDANDPSKGRTDLSRPPSRCCASRRFRATRTARSRPACCCSKVMRIRSAVSSHRLRRSATGTRRRSPASRASTGCPTASRRCSSSTAKVSCSTSSRSAATGSRCRSRCRARWPIGRTPSPPSATATSSSS